MTLVFLLFFALKISPALAKALAAGLIMGLANPSRGRENAAATLGGFFSMCLAHLKISAFTAFFIRSI